NDRFSSPCHPCASVHATTWSHSSPADTATHTLPASWRKHCLPCKQGCTTKPGKYSANTTLLPPPSTVIACCGAYSCNKASSSASVVGAANHCAWLCRRKVLCVCRGYCGVIKRGGFP